MNSFDFGLGALLRLKNKNPGAVLDIIYQQNCES